MNASIGRTGQRFLTWEWRGVKVKYKHWEKVKNENNHLRTTHCEIRFWDLSKYISDAKSLSCSDRTLTRGLCNGCSEWEWEWVIVFREKVEERSLQWVAWDLLSKYFVAELFGEIFAMGALGRQARTTSGRFLSQLYIKESKYKSWKNILQDWFL